MVLAKFMENAQGGTYPLSNYRADTSLGMFLLPLSIIRICFKIPNQESNKRRCLGHKLRAEEPVVVRHSEIGKGWVRKQAYKELLGTVLAPWRLKETRDFVAGIGRNSYSPEAAYD
jgi:hypothetical protein